jgi:hypothetical protein
MNLTKCDISSIHTWNVIKGLLIDLVAIIVVYFIPKIGQIVHFPFYMVEPIRLIVVVSIAHSSRVNSFILALTLPFFSWAVSGHPEFYKMLVMTGEITFNVFLFYYLIRKSDFVFLSMIISIVVSKVLCYVFYLVFFSMMFIREEAEPSFLIAQIIFTLVFSFYIYFVLRKKSH